MSAFSSPIRARVEIDETTGRFSRREICFSVLNGRLPRVDRVFIRFRLNLAEHHTHALLWRTLILYDFHRLVGANRDRVLFVQGSRRLGNGLGQRWGCQ